MRRKNRQTSKDEAMQLLQGGKYGVLSTVGADGAPYAIPVSFAVDGDQIAFHSAKEGHKIENLMGDRRVCFCVVGATQPVFNGTFSTFYESVVVFGSARLVQDEAEKARWLMALCEKYLPENMDKAPDAITSSGAITSVWCIDIEEITGKAHRAKT